MWDYVSKYELKEYICDFSPWKSLSLGEMTELHQSLFFDGPFSLDSIEQEIKKIIVFLSL